MVMHYTPVMVIVLILNTDIDVCSSNKHGCAAEATCTDTMDIDGSYTCDCNAGYTGDGFTCASKSQQLPGMTNIGHQYIIMNTVLMNL